jgi:hypothetical protein
MIKREDIDDLFRCLLSGIAAPVDARQVRFEQSQQLLYAFNRIEDSKLRQELILLIEIVSKMPEALNARREVWGNTIAAQLH